MCERCDAPSVETRMNEDRLVWIPAEGKLFARSDWSMPIQSNEIKDPYIPRRINVAYWASIGGIGAVVLLVLMFAVFG